MTSSVAVVAALTASGAQAQGQSFDVGGQPLLFAGSGTGTGTAVGSFRDYTNVITVGGTQIDARVTLTAISNATLTTFDSTANPYTESNHFQPNLNITAAGGQATFRVEFFAGGQPVTLRNFYVNTYDLDASGATANGRQYTDFTGYDSYALSTGTKVVLQPIAGGGRFVTTVGGNLNYAVGSSDFNTIRARVFYTGASSVTVTLGDTSAAGAAYFGLDFSLGYAFTNVATDNAAPVITTGQSFVYPENRAVDTVVGTVTAADDVGVTAFRFAATGTQVSADGAYAINNSGAIRLTAAGVAAGAATNDFETTPNSFTHAVQAVDAAGNVSSPVPVTLNVTDVGEPVITAPGGTAGAGTAAASVAEGQTAALTLAADRPVTWAITGGADAARFTINATTGAIAFATAPDFEAPADAGADNVYQLIVTATDGTGATATQAVTVTVTDVAEVPLGFANTNGSGGTPSYAFAYPENSAANAPLGTVAASGGTAPYAFAITGGNPGGWYAVDAGTGAITLTAAGAASLANDFEATPNLQTLTVTVTDAAGASTAIAVALSETDVDDTAPTITGGAAAAVSVGENGTAVASLAASEPATWTIAGGADAARFAIDANTGVVTFIAAPDFENPADTDANNSYVLIVRAADAAGNAGTQTLTVTVTDADEAPPVISGPGGGTGTAAISINEGVTAVATFAANEGVTWAIAGGADAARFAINPATGALTLKAAPDFEQPVDADADNVYRLTITATDPAGNVATQAVAVTILDIDDTAPVITAPGGAAGAASAAFSVNEGLMPVTTLAASEAVTWAINGGADAARFAIDPATGALTFAAAPDFEAPADADTDNRYLVTVEATDAAGLRSTQAITVTVLDLDDSAPVITGPSGGAGAAASAVSVDEGVTAVTSLAASEAATWTISGGADAARFTINPATGALAFVAVPDFERPGDADADNIYTLVVTATDAGGNASTQGLTVTVRDLDDAAPVIGAALNAVAVAEGQTAVATATADEAATWSITGGADAASFAIDATTGAISFIAAPDFENPTDAGADNVYDLVVTATDARGNASTRTVRVTVQDLDDTAPTVTGGGAVAVDEGQTAVTTLSADEAVTWSISGGPDAARFTVTPAGAIAFATAPDFEKPGDADADNIYLLTVTATDAGGNATARTITVSVRDRDDTAPVITGPAGGPGAATIALSVNEGTAPVATLTASEAATWAITGGPDAGRFAIDAATGAIRFNAVPDFEAPGDADADNVYLFTVSARDADGNVGEQAVAVTVLDLDDSAPVIGGGDGGAATAFSVAEDQVAVTTLAASEPVTWAIAGGADAARFALDPATGALTFTTAPDFEQPGDADGHNDYALTVTATDAKGNVATRALVVTVTDVDDSPAVITGPAGGAGALAGDVAVREGSTAVATMTASEPVTWSLSGGPDTLRFVIDPTTGVVRFRNPPDYEAPTDSDGNNSYGFAVTATDARGNTSSQAIRVTVTDNDDTAPVIGAPASGGAGGPQAIIVPEGQTTVATLSANEPVAWAIAPGGDGLRFAIDVATGAITFRTPPDFEAPGDGDANNAYQFSVTATDANGNVTTQAITVLVGDGDDTAPRITGPSGGAGAAASETALAEGVLAVASFAANEPVNWSLAGGADAALFAIDPSTGALQFRDATDFENPTDADRNNTYLVRIRAIDQSGNESTQTLTVRVGNTDEIAAKLAEIGGALRSGLRSYALGSLGDMLSFNENLLQARGAEDCTDTAAKPVSGGFNGDETAQQARLSFSQALNGCKRGYSVFFDAAVSSARVADNWTARGLASVRVETRLTPDVTIGAAVMGSAADDKLPGFQDSAISDRTIQLNGYLRARLPGTLRAGVFGGVGRSWYEFGVKDDGLALSGRMSGDRYVYGGMLSGDLPLGDVLLTTDMIYSHAVEKLGQAELAALYMGESRAGIDYGIGSVDLSRLSVPLTAQFTLFGAGPEGLGGTRILLSPGLLCEDSSDLTSSWTCGYQLGARLAAAQGLRGRLYVQYRYESVDAMRRSQLGLGYAYRFGSPLELSVDLDNATTSERGTDRRAMVSLKVAP